MRIVANVNVVDPDDDASDRFQEAPEIPPIHLVADCFLPGITTQLCLQEDDGCLQWLTEDEVESWGVSREELFESAIDNLNHKSLSVTGLHRTNADGGSVYSPLCDGVFLSSLIFADRMFSDFNFDRQDLIAALPNRDSLYFCERSSSESVNILRLLTGFRWEDEDCPRKYRITQNLLVPDSKATFGWAMLPN